MSMGQNSIRKIFLNFGMAACLLLAACVGGGGSPGDVSGGGAPGGFAGNALDGGGGLGNAASGSGPVAMPAPDTVAWEPQTWVAYLMGCINVPGPMVACDGKPGSVDAGADLRLTAYPPGQAGGAPKGPSVDTTAGNDGAWNQSIEADAGDIVGICLMKNGNCVEVLYLVIPPEGGTVNGQQGLMKNLVIDHDGNKIFSRHEDNDSWYVGFSLKNIFLGEAHAEEPATVRYLREGNVNWTAIMMGLQETKTEEAPATLDAAATRPAGYANGTVMSECLGVTSEFIFEQARIETMPGNEATLKRLRPDGVAGTLFPEVIAEFPAHTRADIHDVEVWQADNNPEKEYFAAAVGPHVFMVKNAIVPFIDTRIDFGMGNEVVQLFQADSGIYALVKSKNEGARIENPLYHIKVRSDGKFEAKCAWAPYIFADVKSIIDFEGLIDKFAAIAQMNDGRFALIAGTPDREAIEYNDITNVHPDAIRYYANPVEVANLAYRNPGRYTPSGEGVVLFVLDPVGRKVEFLNYTWGRSPEDMSVTTYTFSQLGLDQLKYSHTLNVDSGSKNISFIDIRESGSELINLAYRLDESGNIIAAPTVTRYALGQEAPTVVRWQGGAWVINSSQGEFRRVERPTLPVSSDIIKEGVANPARVQIPGGHPAFQLREFDGDSDSDD